MATRRSGSSGGNPPPRSGVRSSRRAVLSAFRVASAQNYGLAVVIARGDIRVIDDGIVHVEMAGELKLSLAIQAGRILVPGDLERSVPVLGPMKQGDRFATERANQDV